MDAIIANFVRYYPLAIHHFVFWIFVNIGSFVIVSGCIRFGIAIYRRYKGIYPPATSQMEKH